MDNAEGRANNVVDLVLRGLVSEDVEDKQIALENILYEFLEEDKGQFERLHETMQWTTPHELGDEEEGDE